MGHLPIHGANLDPHGACWCCEDKGARPLVSSAVNTTTMAVPCSGHPCYCPDCGHQVTLGMPSQPLTPYSVPQLAQAPGPELRDNALMSRTGGGLRRDGKLGESKRHLGLLTQSTNPAFHRGEKKTPGFRGKGAHSQTGRVCSFIHSFIHSFIPWMNTDARGKPKSPARVGTYEVPGNSTK